MLPIFLSNTLLQKLITQLTHLKQGGVAGGKALHKPVMLLALMDVLEGRGRAKPEFIPIDETLYKRFDEILGKLIVGAKTGDFFQPVLYLPNEGFWTVYAG